MMVIIDKCNMQLLLLLRNKRKVYSSQNCSYLLRFIFKITNAYMTNGTDNIMYSCSIRTVSYKSKKTTLLSWEETNFKFLKLNLTVFLSCCIIFLIHHIIDGNSNRTIQKYCYSNSSTLHLIVIKHNINLSSSSTFNSNFPRP